MTDELILRMAAIMAIISEISGGNDIANVGRMTGESWSIDHRRMVTGNSSLMHKRSARSPWR